MKINRPWQRLLLMTLATGWCTCSGLHAQDNGKPAAVRKDRLGDVLQHGALARLGSARLQIDGPVVFLPGSDVLVAASQEIHLLDVSSGKELRRLPKKQFRIMKLAVAADGKTLAAFGWDKTVRIVDLPSGKDITTHDCGSQIHSAVFVDGGKRLLTGEGQDHNRGMQFISLRDVLSGKELWRVPGKNCVLAPDGKTVAALGQSPNPNLRFHDMATGRETKSFPNKASDICFSPDGKLLALTSWEGHEVTLWDVAGGKEVQTLAGGRAPVTFTPDSKTVVYWTYDGRRGTMHVANVATGAEIVTLGDGAAPVVFTGDGKTALAPSRHTTGMLGLWDVKSWEELRQISGPDHIGSYLAWPQGAATFSPDGRTVVTVEHFRIRLWETATGKERVTLPGHPGGVVFADFGPKGNTVMSMGQDKTFRWWDATEGKELRRLEGRSLPAALAPDRATAASVGHHGLTWWDTATGKELQRWDAPGLPMRDSSINQAVAFAPDGNTVAWGRSDNAIVILVLKSGKELHRLAGHTQENRNFATHTGLAALAFAPDGKTLASIGADRTLRTWNLAAAKQQTNRTVAGRNGYGFPPWTWTPDSKLLVLQEADGKETDVPLQKMATVIALDPATGQEKSLFPILKAYACALSPDGKTLAYAALREDGYDVVLVDFPTGKEVRRFAGHQRSIHSLAFAPEGNTLASASADGTVLVWEVARR